MASKEYGWSIGEQPPQIELHSITKHRVYEEYLCHYIQVLNSNPLIPEFRLNVVDGFSGGGEYIHPTTGKLYEGSPIRLIKASRAAEAAINTRRGIDGIKKKFNLFTKYYFIEKKNSNYLYLENCLEERGYTGINGENIQLIKSSFTKSIDKVIVDIEKQKGSKRCLFILDQYGYNQVPFPDIKQIFNRLPNAEIILTFATDWLISYMSNDPRYMKGLKKSGIEKAICIDELLEKKLDTIEWRQFVQFELHKAILELSGAKFYTPFFIVSAESKRSFWLVHLSNHPRARDVMTELHWKVKNHFSHYGGHGFKMFGYDPRQDDSLLGMTDMFSNSEYTFDEMAKQQTLKSILVEMPELIYEYKNGISFGEFYRVVANTTPATTEHIRECAQLLIEANELEIKSTNGNVRRSANTIKDSDIVTLPSQNRLITTNRESLIELSKKKKSNKKGKKK